MRSTCDIFRATPDGPLWIEAVQDLEEAKERMARLAVTYPAKYFIHLDGNVVAEQTQEWAEVT